MQAQLNRLLPSNLKKMREAFKQLDLVNAVDILHWLTRMTITELQSIICKERLCLQPLKVAKLKFLI